MDVKILEEAGYKHALYGISLSYNKDIENMEKVSKSLCKLDGGHNKFLESIVVWLEINAARYWWQEFDTYRVGITKQSECFDDKTEILTLDGWKYFKNLKNEDLFCTMNIKNRNIEYQKATNYIENDFNGEVLSINGKSIDLIVTKNHNMVIKCRRSENLRIIPADKFTHSHGIPKKAIWKGKEVSEFILPMVQKETKYSTFYPEKKINMDLWLKFFGFWLAEGCVFCNRNKKNYISSACQVEDSKYIPEIDAIFDELPFKVYRYVEKRKDKKSIIVWKISNKQLYFYLLEYKGALNKYINKDLLTLSKRQLNILEKWLMVGDGCVTFKHYIYISISKKLIDTVQELWLKLGYSSSIRIHREAQNNCKRVYSIARHRTSYAYALKNNIKKVNYKGKIYCVEVPNHIILARRNGKIVWTGNSTIHTLLKSRLTQNNFESDIPEKFLNYLNTIITNYHNSKNKNKAEFTKEIKNILPEGFLQRRIVCTNYKVLKNMINQRKNHTLGGWKMFINHLKNNLEHSDLIF